MGYENRPTIKVYEPNGEIEECYVNIKSYASDKLVMALELVTKEDKEPYDVISVNLGECYRNATFVPNGATFIDVNNAYYNLSKVLEQMGGKPYTYFGQPYYKQSGFCEYPLIDFDKNILKELDPEGFVNYDKEYWEEIPKAQERLRKELGLPEEEEEIER